MHRKHENILSIISGLQCVCDILLQFDDWLLNHNEKKIYTYPCLAF